MILFKLSLFASLFTLNLAEWTSDPPSLTLPSGKLAGLFKVSDVSKRKFAAFHSIPYAKPPIGELRFKPPVPIEPWKGTLMATQLPPICPQMNIMSREPKIEGSEDCLYLNVFSPRLPEKNSKLLDVIFIIHGGAFMVGSSNTMGVEKLMDRDVVVVTINYRLGALGFLSTEDEASPGNNGLKDQSLALTWTKENIAYFGGDPDKITISGCSAGGASVHYHILSKMSKGLFQKAIPDSGSALNPWSFKENPKKEAFKLASSLGCPTKCTEEMIKCLKQRPAEHLISKQICDIFTMKPELQFVPSVEPPSSTAFLDKHPRDVMANGETSDVPILFSAAKDEGLLFLMMILGDTDKMKEVEDNWEDIVVPLVTKEKLSPSLRHEIAEALKKSYLGDKQSSEIKAGITKMMGDYGFNLGIEESAKMMAQVHKSPVYSYQFAYRGKLNFTVLQLPDEVYKGVNHCEHSNYVAPFVGCKIDEDEPMSELLMNMIMNFIQGKSLAKNWKPVNDGLPKYSLFEISSSDWDKNELKIYDDFSKAKLWKSLKDKTVNIHNEL